jgi:hypothetical protein
MGLIFSVAYWPSKVAQAPEVTTQVVQFVNRGLRGLEPACG